LAQKRNVRKLGTKTSGGSGRGQGWMQCTAPRPAFGHYTTTTPLSLPSVQPCDGNPNSVLLPIYLLRTTTSGRVPGPNANKAKSNPLLDPAPAARPHKQPFTSPAAHCPSLIQGTRVPFLHIPHRFTKASVQHPPLRSLIHSLTSHTSTCSPCTRSSARPRRIPSRRRRRQSTLVCASSNVARCN
jgi:hypothetical protein